MIESDSNYEKLCVSIYLWLLELEYTLNKTINIIMALYIYTIYYKRDLIFSIVCNFFVLLFVLMNTFKKEKHKNKYFLRFKYT